MEVSLGLTQSQLQKILSAKMKKQPVSFRISNKALTGDRKLFVSPTMAKRIEKCRAQGKGCIIKVSHQNLRQFELEGGFAPAIGQALATIAPQLIQSAPAMFQALGPLFSSIKGLFGNGMIDNINKQDEKVKRLFYMSGAGVARELYSQGVICANCKRGRKCNSKKCAMNGVEMKGGFLPLLALALPALMSSLGGNGVNYF